jgi:hypothetical protein
MGGFQYIQASMLGKTKNIVPVPNAFNAYEDIWKITRW